MSRLQNLAFVLVKLHTVFYCPVLQFTKIFLRPCGSWLLVTKGVLVSPDNTGVCLFVCICVRRSVAARRVGLWPQGLVYPGASSYRNWNSGAATGQCKCLSPAVGETHTVKTCIHVLSTHMSAGNAPSAPQLIIPGLWSCSSFNCLGLSNLA